jgi:hypothetical protein
MNAPEARTGALRSAPTRSGNRRRCITLNRVALDQEQRFADIVVDSSPTSTSTGRTLIDVSARAASIRVRFRLHMDELGLLAVAWTAPSPEEKASCISVR